MITHFRQIVTFAIVATLVLLLITVVASGQTLTPWYHHIFESTIDQETIRLLREELDLTEDQLALVEVLYDEHQERFRAFCEKNKPIRRVWDERIETTKVATLERHKLDLAREEALAPIVEAQLALDRAFLDSIEPILTDAQLDRWPLALAAFHRRTWLRTRWTLPNQRIDLIAMTRRILENAPNAAVDHEALDTLEREYALTLDRVLMTMIDAEMESNRRFMRDQVWRMATDGEKTWMRGNLTDEETQKFYRGRRETYERFADVADVNIRYLHRFRAVLPAEQAHGFDLAHARHVLTRESRRADRIFTRFVERVRAMPDLTDSQREAFRLAEMTYEIRLIGLVRRGVESQRERAKHVFLPPEEEDPREQYRLEQQVEADLAEIGEDHASLVDTLRDQVLLVLSPAQREALPEQEPTRRGGDGNEE